MASSWKGHAEPASASSGNPNAVPEPSLAERARTLLHLGRLGTLSTLSHKLKGAPFGSLAPYALDGQGRPLFLLSGLAVHTQNIKVDPRASLFVCDAEPRREPLGAARATLMGTLTVPKVAEEAEVRRHYLLRHEGAKAWADYGDFGFYRLQVADVYFVGGFGVMGWVPAADYLAAEPDPLAEDARGILEKANSECVAALISIARRSMPEAESAIMTSVDRLGFTLRVATAGRVKGARVAFPREVRSAHEALFALRNT